MLPQLAMGTLIAVGVVWTCASLLLYRLGRIAGAREAVMAIDSVLWIEDVAKDVVTSPEVRLNGTLAALRAHRDNLNKGLRTTVLNLGSAQVEDLLGSIWLYIDWHYVTRQLTTAQKDWFADAVVASHRRMNDDDTPEDIADFDRRLRWWRE